MAATSSGRVRAPVSVWWVRWAAGLGDDSGRVVSTAPGTTQLAVTRSAARSCASARLKPTSAAFAVMTWARFLAPICALMPPMLTIAPAPLSFSAGRQAVTQWKAPSSVTSITSRQSA